MNLTTIATLIGEIVVILGVIVPVIISIRKIANGTKCQLRSEMLRIYYDNKDSKKIRQYEKENFLMLFGAYKALKGNSFVDDISAEVRSWEVIS